MAVGLRVLMVSSSLEMGAWSLANSTFSAVTPPAGRFCVKTAPFSQLSCQGFIFIWREIMCEKNCTIQLIVTSGFYLYLARNSVWKNCTIQSLVMSRFYIFIWREILCEKKTLHHSATGHVRNLCLFGVKLGPFVMLGLVYSV